LSRFINNTPQSLLRMIETSVHGFYRKPPVLTLVWDMKFYPVGGRPPDVYDCFHVG